MDPVWKPLEEKLGPNRCVGFMYMGRVNGVHQYKHGITRTYLNFDDLGNCCVWNQTSEFVIADFAIELAKLETNLRECDATLEAPYDDRYIARKGEFLQALGIQTLRIEIKPQNRTIGPRPRTPAPA